MPLLPYVIILLVLVGFFSIDYAEKKKTPSPIASGLLDLLHRARVRSQTFPHPVAISLALTYGTGPSGELVSLFKFKLEYNTRGYKATIYSKPFSFSTPSDQVEKALTDALDTTEQNQTNGK